MYLSVNVEPERLLGHLFKAMLKGEKLMLSVSRNKSDNPNAPKYTNQNMGISVWVKESKLEE